MPPPCRRRSPLETRPHGTRTKIVTRSLPTLILAERTPGTAPLTYMAYAVTWLSAEWHVLSHRRQSQAGCIWMLRTPITRLPSPNIQISYMSCLWVRDSQARSRRGNKPSTRSYLLPTRDSLVCSRILSIILFHLLTTYLNALRHGKRERRECTDAWSRFWQCTTLHRRKCQRKRVYTTLRPSIQASQLFRRSPGCHRLCQAGAAFMLGLLPLSTNSW